MTTSPSARLNRSRSDHLFEDAGAGLEQHVGQQQREGLVAYQLAGAPDRVAEPERRLLAGEADGAGFRLVLRQDLLLPGGELVLAGR